MIAERLLDAVPLWAVFLITVGLTSAAVEAGFRLGRLRRRADASAGEGVGPMVGATLALLAFLLAFVTGISVDRYDTRRQLVVVEANAIGTADLRAGLLDEPYRSESRDLLSEYVDARLMAVEGEGREEAIRRSERLHAALWGRAAEAAVANPEHETVALYVAALNEVIDVHTNRVVAALIARIPVAVYVLLFAIASLAMALVGLQMGYGGRRRVLASWLLILSYSAVVLLIMDLDRSQEGLMRVDQQPLVDLQSQPAATDAAADAP